MPASCSAIFTTAATAARRQFPLHLGSEGSAQIGGLISTNAGGTGVVRYGPMRDLVAGLEVVLADGRVLSDLAALRKDNTGYMLRHLFIGAEGTLGVITGAALRLHSQTPNTAHAWVSVADPAAAVALFTALQDRAGSYIQAFELVSASQFELVRRHIPRVRFPVRGDSRLVGADRARQRGCHHGAQRDSRRGCRRFPRTRSS